MKPQAHLKTRATVIKVKIKSSFIPGEKASTTLKEQQMRWSKKEQNTEKHKGMLRKERIRDFSF